MTPILPTDSRYLDQTPWTPLVPVRLDADGPSIWCKLEFMLPSGSTKDRIARYILEKAWRRGDIGPGSVVIEASSGSTSIALALACAQLGLKFIAVMPEGVSEERSLIIKSFGGSVEFSDKGAGVRGSIEASEKLAAAMKGYLPRQFENPDNAEAHRRHTAAEVLSQVSGGCVDAVVSGVGTGGTLVGMYQGFADAGCPVTPFAARPMSSSSPCFSEPECSSFSSRIPGVVDGLSKIYRREDLPGLQEIEVADADALHVTRRLIRRGFPVGPSSGLNYAAAVAVARRREPDATVVTVFPDRMERYFSTELFRAE